MWSRQSRQTPTKRGVTVHFRFNLPVVTVANPMWRPDSARPRGFENLCELDGKQWYVSFKPAAERTASRPGNKRGPGQPAAPRAWASPWHEMRA
eukprot:2564024-Prymnesium_polylepis.1